jgi:ankyrin repeat protein
MFHYHALYFNSKKGDRVKRRSAPGLGHIKTIDLFNISCYFEETVIQKFYNELADEEEKTEEENTEDLMFLHILDCIGCIGNLTHNTHADSLTKSKRSVFWKAVREIADLELKNLSQREKEEREEEMEMVTVDLHNSAISLLLEHFPVNHHKVYDGRSWMPLYWAVSLPNVEFEDIHNLMVTVSDGDENSVELLGSPPLNLVHLACMANSSVNVLNIFEQYFPRLLKDYIDEDYYNYTSLHFAVKYRNLSWVRELSYWYPSLVEMSDEFGCIPLLLLFQEFNDSLVAQQILVELIHACPNIPQKILSTLDVPVPGSEGSQLMEYLMVSHKRWLPLFFLLHYCNECGNSSTGVLEMVSTLLTAYPDALIIQDANGCFPIHIAATRSPVHVLQLMISNTRPETISALANNGLSVVHMAVRGLHLDNLRFILSIKPELMLVKDSKGRSPIAHLIARLGDDIYNLEDDLSDFGSPLSDFESTLSDFELPLSNRSEILWFLLRIWPSINESNERQDVIDEFKVLYIFLSSSTNSSYFDFPRRRLLKANIPNLNEPEILRNLNYSARRGAMFLFFRNDDSNSNSVVTRIIKGPGSDVLIRNIISFL